MTDATSDTTDAESITDHAGASGGDSRLPFEDVTQAVAWAGLAVSTIVAVVALHRFYVHATAAVTDLVGQEHADLFLAGFNLVVLLLAGAAVAVLVRWLSTVSSQ